MATRLAIVLALLAGCDVATGASQPAASDPRTGCDVDVEFVEGGPDMSIRGEGFEPDRSVVLTVSGNGEPTTFTEQTNPALRTDSRGVVIFGLAGERQNIGPARVEISAGECTAGLTVDVLEAMFPPACPATEPVASGGTASDAYLALVLGDEPVGYWRFEDLAGPLALATVGQPGAVTGDLAFGQAGAIDGSRSLVLGPDGGKVDIVDLEFAGDVTIEGWLSFCDDPIGSEDGLFAAPGGAPNVNFFSAAPRFWTGDTDLVFADDESVEHARWYHVALVRSNGAVTLFVDGESLGTAAFEAPIGVDLFGDMGGGEASVQLDELAVYDHALSPEDLAERSPPPADTASS